MTALGGHISHIYEDLDLRFRDIKQIFRSLGYADIDTYEKLDGQNLFVCWDFDRDCLIVARNKQNVKDGGLDRFGLSIKFGDRPEIEKLFVDAYDALNEAFKPLHHNAKSQIFGSMGTIWFPVEIINPELPNTILYNDKYIIFHEHDPVLFGFDGEPISKGLPRNMTALKSSIKEINANTNRCTIKAPECFLLLPVDESVIDKSCILIDTLLKKTGHREGITVRTYLFERLKDDMQRFPLVPEQIRSNIAKNLTKMPGYRPLREVLASADFQIRKYAKSMAEEEKKIMKKLLMPIEMIVHGFSSKLISNLKSSYIEDAAQESERINKEYRRCCDIIRNSDNDKWIKLLGDMEPKIGNSNVTMEGLVFKFNDKLYKSTGSFTPMNRIIAAIKYANKDRVANKANQSLANFMFAG